MDLTNDPKYRTAVHESGHLVACLKLGIYFDYVTIESGVGSAGNILYAEHYDNPQTPEEKRRAERVILCYAAGRAAVKKLKGTDNTHLGDSGDHQSILEAIYALGFRDPGSLLMRLDDEADNVYQLPERTRYQRVEQGTDLRRSVAQTAKAVVL